MTSLKSWPAKVRSSSERLGYLRTGGHDFYPLLDRRTDHLDGVDGADGAAEVVSASISPKNFLDAPQASIACCTEKADVIAKVKPKPKMMDRNFMAPVLVILFSSGSPSRLRGNANHIVPHC